MAGLALCGGKENSCWVAQGLGQAGRWHRRCNVVAETVVVLRDEGRGAVCTGRHVLTAGELGREVSPSKRCGEQTGVQPHGSAPVGWRSGAGPEPNGELLRTSSAVVEHLEERPSCAGQGLVASVEGRPSGWAGLGCSSLH